MEYFGTEEYNAGIQNFAISQDYRGILLVANNFGLLEYDGTEWRKHGINKGTKVRSVFTDSKGRVYIGAQNEIGYFFPSGNGQYVYHSMNDLIPEEYSDFDEIWNIYSTEKGLVFTGSSELFFYDIKKNTIDVLPLSNTTDFSFFLRGKLLTGFKTGGLKQLDGDGWISTPFSGFFDGMQVTGVIPFNNESTLIGTYSNGLYLIDQNGEITTWANTYQTQLKKHRINKVLRLKSGSIAIGTISNGLHIFDEYGELVFQFSENRGIVNQSVLAIYQDSFGNIWIGLNNGIAKIEWQSPFNLINEELGLQGTGYVALGSDDKIYFGTNTGLYLSRKGFTPHGQPISKIQGIEGQIYNIQNIRGSLLVASHTGAFEIIGDNIRQISSQIGWWTFVETSNPNLAIAGTYKGLTLLKRQGNNWQVEKVYEGFSESSRVLEFDEKGILWMSHGYKGVYSFEFSEDFQSIENSHYYGSESGFPSNLLINVFKVNQKLIFPAERGIYSYNPETDSFFLDDRYNASFNGDSHIREIAEDSFGNLFFIGTEKSGMLKKNAWGEFEPQTDLFQKLHSSLNDDLENISIIDDTNILFSSKDGFVNYRNSPIIDVDHNIKLLIRSVLLTTNDSLIFNGNYFDDNKVLLTQPQAAIPTISYKLNSLLINYSAIDYNQSQTLYRLKLDGFDNNWSDWTPKTYKEYTNLMEGSYTFMVEAKDVYGNLSSMEEYRFSISPPWYRTWYSYLGYFIISISGIVLSIIVGQRKIKYEKNLIIDRQKKELIDRETQIETVSRTTKEEIEKLKMEKLRSEIKHKNKELATTAMHLIDKNSFINSIKNSLNEIVKKDAGLKNQKELNRIIRNIDKNIASDGDWKQFEMHFDEVHEEFLKKLRMDYSQITPQEVKLSAYLRMNMSTKEIAELLRISVRGVEIARYRLRKKLELPKETNLVDFMMNY